MVKRYVAALWISFALLFGSGILTAQFGVDLLPTTYACGVGSNAGGGCS